MKQITFAESEYHLKRRKTRREKFLEQMEQLIPWGKLEKKLSKHYYKNKTGRAPYPLPVMLRVHCLQLFYNLSDPAMEDALYEIESMRRFAGLRLVENIPDETTILNFRHWLEAHQLGKKLFAEINAHLQQAGLLWREGSIVDASIIAAPTSTKNQSHERDPEMHQVKKGNEWYFGMKLHIGVDDASGIIHSLETTPANEHDITQVAKLLHGDEKRVWGDSGFIGVQKREEHRERKVDWLIAERPSKRQQMPAGSEAACAERIKAQVRAKVEHPFRYIKQVFHYGKVRYRGLMKNANRLWILAGLTNLLICKSSLVA